MEYPQNKSCKIIWIIKVIAKVLLLAFKNYAILFSSTKTHHNLSYYEQITGHPVGFGITPPITGAVFPSLQPTGTGGFPKEKLQEFLHDIQPRTLFSLKQQQYKYVLERGQNQIRYYQLLLQLQSYKA